MVAITEDIASAIMPGMAKFAEVTEDTVVIDPPVGKTGKVFDEPSDLTPCKYTELFGNDSTDTEPSVQVVEEAGAVVPLKFQRNTYNSVLASGIFS